MSQTADKTSSPTPIFGAGVGALLGDNRFRLVYQPIVHAKSGKVIGVEALLRVDDPNFGSLGPSDFLASLLEAGHSRSITDFTLTTALSELELLAEHLGVDNLAMSINFSASQMRDRGIVDRVADALVTHGVPPRRLTLEVVEDLPSLGIGAAAEVLGRLRKLGVSVALDDFGTGRGSMVHFVRLPCDFIKIDGGFVAAMKTDERARAAIAASIVLAHSSGIEIIAEGVADADQSRALTEMGCDYLQGYFHGRPFRVADSTVEPEATPAPASQADRATLAAIAARLSDTAFASQSAQLLETLDSLEFHTFAELSVYHSCRSTLLLSTGQTDQGLEAMAIAAIHARRANDSKTAVLMQSRLSAYAVGRGDLRVAHEAMAATCRLLENEDLDPTSRYSAIANIGLVAYILGDPAQAIGIWLSGIRNAGKPDLGALTRLMAVNIASVALGVLEFGERSKSREIELMHTALDEAMVTLASPQMADLGNSAMLRTSFDARRLLLGGDVDGASTALEKFEPDGDLPAGVTLMWATAKAEVETALGNTAAALSWVDLALAEAADGPWFLGSPRLYQLRATALSDADNHIEALATYETARAELESTLSDYRRAAANNINAEFDLVEIARRALESR